MCEASAAAPQTCSTRCGWVGDHSRAPIFTRREYRCRPGLHRLGCGGSTPPSRRVRVANFDSEAPALNRMEHGASPWRPTTLPAWLSSDRCLRTATALRAKRIGGTQVLSPPAPFFEGRRMKSSRRFACGSILPSAFVSASVVKLPSSWWPCASTFERRVCR